MNKLKTIGLTIIITVGLVILGYTLIPKDNSTGGYAYNRCQIMTSTAVVVGDDISSTILSASSGRAWARIQLVTDDAGIATSSVYIMPGATATLLNGIKLSTSTPYIEVGMNTEFAYTGAISGITTGSASTTIQVVECR